MTIKVCGITRLEDAQCAADLGVHALGFVFWPGSPRAVSSSQAETIIGSLPPFLMPVGVFVDPTAALLAECQSAGITTAQVVGEVPALPRGMRLLRAVTLGTTPGSIVPVVPGASPVLVDAHDPVRRGGTGRRVDWQAAAAVARRRPVILAGGLQSDNVADAIRLVCPVGVDVSSGVEASPGIKDARKLAAFVAAVRPFA